MLSGWTVQSWQFQNDWWSEAKSNKTRLVFRSPSESVGQISLSTPTPTSVSGLDQNQEGCLDWTCLVSDPSTSARWDKQLLASNRAESATEQEMPLVNEWHWISNLNPQAISQTSSQMRFAEKIGYNIYDAYGLWCRHNLIYDIIWLRWYDYVYENATANRQLPMANAVKILNNWLETWDQMIRSAVVSASKLTACQLPQVVSPSLSLNLQMLLQSCLAQWPCSKLATGALSALSYT